MDKKFFLWRILGIVVCLGILLFMYSYIGIKNEAPKPLPIIGENLEGEADPSRMTLGMTEWKWIRASYNDGSVSTPNKSDAFKLVFKDDGTFSLSTDCNGVGGNYEAKDGKLAFTQMISTLMYCEGSQEVEVRQILENTTEYHFTGRGELILGLKFDSGTATFR